MTQYMPLYLPRYLHLFMRIARRPAVLALLVGTAACSGDSPTSSTSTGTDTNTGTTTTTSTTVAVSSVNCNESPTLTNPVTVTTAMAANTADHEVTSDYTYSAASAETITLSGTTITTNSANVTVSGTTATIKKVGTYVVSGTLTDGQLLVTTSDTGVVKVVLNGAAITRSADAPFVVTKAKRVAVILASGTTNTLTDGATYPSGVDENAALFSKANLSIGGDGALTVKANYEDGITSKDGLVIRSGTITVTAKDDGIRGKDYLVVRGGTFVVTAGGDGLKSDEDGDATLGYVLLAGGTFTIAAQGDAVQGDAVQGETDVLMSGGTITATTYKGSGTLINDTLSAKGLKAQSLLVVDAGTFTVDASDDGVHSNGKLVINGGTITVASADDGVHADSALTINGGDINVTKSYEGLENAAADMTINGGRIRLVATDDALNVSGAGDSQPGQGGSAASAYYLRMTGGRITAISGGDGIDVNGSITMSGGCFIVHGPTANNNAPIDYDGTFVMTGGFVASAGSSGMVQAPSTGSTVPYVLAVLTSARAANTLIHVQTASGTSIVDFLPSKSYQSMLIASSALTVGGSFQWYFGGSESGTVVTDGFYTSGTYTLGTLYKTFTTSAVGTRLSM